MGDLMYYCMTFGEWHIFKTLLVYLEVILSLGDTKVALSREP